MIAIKKDDLFRIKDLYSFDIDVKSIIKSKLEIPDIIDINEEIIITDPSLEELKLITNLRKKVIVCLTYVHEEFYELLKNEYIKLILLVDDLDFVALDQRGIKNIELIYPAKDFAKKENKISGVSIFRDIKDSNALIIREVSECNCLEVNLFGIKEIDNENTFNGLMSLVHSNVDIRPYPIFTFLEDVVSSQCTLDFIRKEFPIVSFYSIMAGNMSFIYSKRYYRWITDEWQNPNTKNILDLINDKDKFMEIQKEKMKMFEDRKRIEEVLE